MSDLRLAPNRADVFTGAMRDSCFAAGEWAIEFAGRGLAIGRVDLTQP